MSSLSKISLFFSISAVVFLAGCASPKYSYKDSGESRNLGTQVGSYDIQMNAEALVNDMLASPVLARKLGEQFPGKRPIISCLPIANKTKQLGISQQLNLINDKIAMKLTNTDKFEFMDLARDNQELSGIITDIMDSPVSAERQKGLIGHQDRPDLILSGRMVEIREQSGRTTESYYSLIMEVTDLLTQKKLWIGEHEIRKAAEKSRMGW